MLFLTFQRNVSYHVHVTCLCPDLHTWRLERVVVEVQARKLPTFQSCDTNGYFWGDLGAIYSHVFGDQNSHFKPKHDLFLTLTQCFLWLNLTWLCAELSEYKSIDVKLQQYILMVCKNVNRKRIHLFWLLCWRFCATQGSPFVKHEAIFPQLP